MLPLVLAAVLASTPAGSSAGAELGLSSLPSPRWNADARNNPLWAWPVRAAAAVARDYLAPPTPYGRGHRGVDLHAPEGTTVLAPAAGTVHFAGWVVDRPVLSIRHEGGLLSSYEPVESELSTGDRVMKGETIGTVVAGHCSDVGCLHFGARLHGEYISPMLLLGTVPRSVLLPTRRLP
ncbi:M23 family metallopeptidase [Ruicaihuangia caeni]|uniref:M23 family metallopeptidase n=1 Tax=Ruicaihuangia caeni TaxID=3042517 RepID=A0AAW6T1Q1_9MICO|nr:M23 family metallopeptidase [Klugiella sp. YN-L-19]MDI2097717.1 M23 family metallopeptidase [Klugiella sp. YN-L-19]